MFDMYSVQSVMSVVQMKSSLVSQVACIRLIPVFGTWRISVNSRLACSIYQVPGQPELHSEVLSLKNKNKEKVINVTVSTITQILLLGPLYGFRPVSCLMHKHGHPYSAFSSNDKCHCRDLGEENQDRSAWLHNLPPACFSLDVLSFLRELAGTFPP